MRDAIIHLMLGIVLGVSSFRAVAQDLPRDVNQGFIVSAGDVCPDFALAMCDGDTLDSDFWRGRVVMLQFIAPWCPVSFAEVRRTETKIWQRFGENPDFVMISVNVDSVNDGLAAFVERTGAHCPFAVDNSGDVFSRFAHRTAGVTRSVLISADGRIRMLTRLYNRRKVRRLARGISAELKRVGQIK